VELLEPAREDLDGLEARSLFCFSAFGVFEEDIPTMLPKSRAPPGVLGVFEEPKEAKAPDPRPNALDAAADGEEMEDVEGDTRLKGVLVPCDELSPCLLPSV